MFKVVKMNYFFEERSNFYKDNIPLSVYYCKNFNFRAHWHTEFELAYVESGNIYICISNERQKLSKGDISICTGGKVHYYENADSSAIVILIFKPEFFGFPADFPGTHQLKSPFLKKEELNSANLNNIITILHSILEEKLAKRKQYNLFIKAKIIKLCALILRYLQEHNSCMKNPEMNLSKIENIAEILLYIENNFTEDISLQTLADKFNMDAYNLSKSFNSITGITLKNYINNLRISKADNLIQNTKKPLIDIAFECGFNNVRTFNRIYKAIKGYPPSTARKTNSCK